MFKLPFFRKPVAALPQGDPFGPSAEPVIEFFQGIPETLGDVSLRQHAHTQVRSVLFTFPRLRAIEKFNSFTQNTTGDLKLRDPEGCITVTPSSCRFIFGGDDGDDLLRVECAFELTQNDHWDRFMRFMHRYADANGMAYGESPAPMPIDPDASPNIGM